MSARPETASLHSRILACAAKHGMSRVQFEIMTVRRQLRSAISDKERLVKAVAALSSNPTVMGMKFDGTWLRVDHRVKWGSA